jgi:hypothetical protein
MSDTLPPLPDPRPIPGVSGRHMVQWGMGFTADQMHAYASAAVAAERERCAIAGGVAADAGLGGFGVAMAIRAET